jgi:hypothetical protein
VSLEREELERSGKGRKSALFCLPEGGIGQANRLRVFYILSFDADFPLQIQQKQTSEIEKRRKDCERDFTASESSAEKKMKKI